jgi:hypothetical protein
MKKIRLSALGAACASSVALLLTAPLAHAGDSSDFVNYLAANGQNVSSPEISYASIDLGEAICGLIEANHSVSSALEYMVNRSPRPRSYPEARIWVDGSLSYLCPELRSLPS